MNTPGTNTGHGHVWTRPDGITARCGGPGLCDACAADAWDNRPGKPPPARDDAMKTYAVEYDANSEAWLIDVETNEHIVLEHGMVLDIARIQPCAPPSAPGEETP